MNHIYHSIWNESLGTWVAVSEISKGQGKRSANRRKNSRPGWASPTLLATGLLLCSSGSWALPTGNQLMAGQASINTPNANSMQINQASQKAVINWQGFSIAPKESVNIQQPNAQAALLNRVVGQDASQIQGKLNANGQVYLVNPNGVLFSKTSQVDVGGLVATTHNIKDADFINGNNHFTQDGAKGTVENHGSIKTHEGGVVALIGESVTNTGRINTPKGTTALAAGKTVDLDFKGDGLVEVKVIESALNAQITNKGAIQADGGRVVLTAKAAGQLIDTVINQEGIIRARGLVERNGEIILEGGMVTQTGTLDASGKTGGTVDIKARAILDTGKTNADGLTGSGGKITLTASDAIIQTARANTHANGKTTGGTVHLEATNSVYSSGKLSATGKQGGTIDVVSADRVTLAAADVNASGSQKGGLIRIGGDFHGAKTKLSNNAKTTIVNGATKLKADGGKGQVVVWSDEKTDYYGTISANKAGNIEVSSKEGTLTYVGFADGGMGGKLLLDPKNIIISATGDPASYGLIDPHKAAGNLFGYRTALLGTTVGKVFTENGNIVVSSPQDDFAATDAGAVYLFNTTTGALLAALTGARANDHAGLNGITALTNGNYVVSSVDWNNGGNRASAGAATWGNGLTGVSGIISAANSLVGSNTFDQVSSNGITALTNGNYVVGSEFWSFGSVGAATWGNGATGIRGTISAANSLVGSIDNDKVSSNGIIALTNGNYVVASSNRSTNADQLHEGAATWGNGLTGIRGVISSTNSLIGSSVGDNVSSNGITALANGNYVVRSANWDNGSSGTSDVGAATWGNGKTGISGIISSTNSLIGSSAFDSVSASGVTALSNGNYVVSSRDWDNNSATAINAGAATWGNGKTGISGEINSTNSLVGTNAFDWVSGGGITALTNGNYVVSSADWADTLGAATWGNGKTGISGEVSTANSLTGSGSFDFVSSSGVTALSNGNYVVGSPDWNGSRGAATWGNGATGLRGKISPANSLTGIRVLDRVSSNGITALTNGNYVVSSPNWNANRGAATWRNGATGIGGTVSAANSLTGSTVGDYVSGAPSINLLLFSASASTTIDGITALPNGNYVVSSAFWNNGAIINAGASTWGNGFTGISGIVSTINSLTGSATFDWSTDFGQHRVTGLSNGNYVLAGSYWDNAGLVNAGQVRIGTPGNILFANGLGQTMLFNPSTLAATLALGTNITLQASNDIFWGAGSGINVNGSHGGALTLQAGRNITLNSSINTANGSFVAIAGDPAANPSDRDPGTPTITLGAGTTINAGAGKVILAAIGGNFVNNTGSTAPISASQWWVYSTDPRQNSRNGMVADYKHYGQVYTGQTPDYANVGNWFLYSITPVLTITPDQTIAFGSIPHDFSFTITGFLDGDTIDTAGIFGSATFDVNSIGTPGHYNISYLRGLASRLGYVFADNPLSVDELTVNPEDIVSQISPLQRSTVFSLWDQKKLARDKDLLDIENNGIKLPAKLHRIIALAIACSSGANNSSSN